ncbi:MAG: hypothetical protein DVB25_08335 [Verrucomicrobia bacterium]|nr:MAG: hypothetical protein DVB25_08335 [Verrucomicrobiota bacterium]
MSSDPLLEAAIAAAIRIDDGLDGRQPTFITLCVGGMLINGQIISATEYMRSNDFCDILDEVSRSQDQTGEAPISIPKTETLDEGYIHLKKAKYILGDFSQWIIAQDEEFFWRGRTDSIVGFSFGIISKKLRTDSLLSLGAVIHLRSASISTELGIGYVCNRITYKRGALVVSGREQFLSWSSA